MRLIVDASIAVKWLIAEPHSHEARQLLAPRIVLHAPDFVLTEVANVIRKKARRKEIPSPQPYVDELAKMTDAVALQPSTELVVKATALAVRIDHPVYDCVYLACAEEWAAPLVTADERLARRVSEAHPTVAVWNIGEAEVTQRITAAATALVIQDDTVQRAMDAYDTFRKTADSVIETVQRGPSAARTLSPEDQDAYFETPAYRQLTKFIASLTLDERVDLKALAWYGRQAASGANWAYRLDHACRMGADDLDYEASLGRHWRSGFDRLRHRLDRDQVERIETDLAQRHTAG